MNKCKPMSKPEVLHMIGLIRNSKIILSKETNANSNRQKEAAWLDLSNKFNSIFTNSPPRRPEQLRLKWENLKKLARKRNAAKKNSQNKTGGGPPIYFPPDEALDSVAEVLGASCDGFTVEYGGDATVGDSVNIEDVSIHDMSIQHMSVTESEVLAGEASSPKDLGEVSQQEVSPLPPSVATPRRNYFLGVPKSRTQIKRKQESEALLARCERDRAIADYYKSKRIKIDLENKKLELEIKKLEIDVDVLI